MKFFCLIIAGALLLTFALPWVDVAGEEFSPGQLLLPYARYFLVKSKILKPGEHEPNSIDQVMLYEKSIRFLAAPPEEGGPRNQITFELIGMAMGLCILCLCMPFQLTYIVGSVLSFASSAAFFLAMILFEKKQIPSFGIGIFGNMAVSLVLTVVVYFIH